MKTVLERAIIILHACILVMVVWQFGGCFGADEVTIPDPDAGLYPFPETPDQLMANFVSAYASRDLAGYAATLHPDFTFVPVGKGASLTRDDELRVATNMFSGQDREKDGLVIAGISRIVFERCVAVGGWRPEGEALRRTYSVRIYFERDRGSTLIVDGVCEFVVAAVDLPAGGGETRRGYQVLRQVDHTD